MNIIDRDREKPYSSPTGSPRAVTRPRVAIGRALQPFPRSKRSRRVSPHSAFQLGLRTLEGRIRRCRRQRRTSPSRAVICFPLCVRCASILTAYPGGPSPCPGHYSQAFGYYAASALRPARWHFRVPPRWVKRHGSSPVPTQELIATRSCLLYAGWYQGQHEPVGDRLTPRHPFWARCLNQFHLFVLTTFSHRFLASA